MKQRAGALTWPRFLPLVLSLAPILATASAAAPLLAAENASAIERRIADLERKLEELRKELADARKEASAVSPAALREIERRLDILAGEIEKLRSGSGGMESPLSPAHGLGPAASKIYRHDHGVSIGGYGEALYENFDARADDGSPSSDADRIDLVRAVLYFGYKFETGIIFNSEIEYEHATTGEGAEEKGEVSVEFAYLDFPLGENRGIRAGQLLLPVGFINELHEPPVFLGARRPDVERFIIPTTWREVGAGVYGEAGSVSWRAYVQAGLDASGFTAAGIRDGRQSGSASSAEDFALAARLDWSIRPGLLLGGSFYGGDAGQGLVDTSDRTIAARTTLFEVHSDWRWRRWQARALYAEGRVGDVDRLNGALSLSGIDSIGEENHGWYAETGCDLLQSESGSSLVPYLRYERYGTQDRVPAGFDRDPALRVRVRTIGVAYKPIANVVVKADFQDYENDGDTGVDRFNLALGYLF